MIKLEANDGKLDIIFDYNENLKEALKSIGARWNSGKSCWQIDTDKQALVERVVKSVMGFDLKDQDETITVRFSVKEFIKENTVMLDNLLVARRRSRDAWVSIYNGAYPVIGEFPKSCGSAKYPAILDRDSDEDVMMEITVAKSWYKSRSQEVRDKLTIIKD